MVVRSEQEAMFVACEMESTAVQLYTRALALMDAQDRRQDPLYQSLQGMLQEEKEHLRHFRSFYQGLGEADEQQLTLSAVGEGVLFEGGLMGAARRGLLRDVPSMLRLAIAAERTSIEKYREFAQHAQNEDARSALLRIAEEESGHLLELEALAQSAC